MSKHARRKLEERMLSLDVVRNVVANPKFVFYDLLSRAFVAVSEVGVESVRISLVVVYVRKDNVIRVVTVYPCRRIDREIDRKVGVGRWVRVK